MSTALSYLNLHGLLNQTGPTFEEMQAARVIERHAFCTSEECSGDRRTPRGKCPDILKIQKSVSQSLTDCPDCGSALFWEAKKVCTTRIDR